jgi:hypothetical protein
MDRMAVLSRDEDTARRSWPWRHRRGLSLAGLLATVGVVTGLVVSGTILASASNERLAESQFVASCTNEFNRSDYGSQIGRAAPSEVRVVSYSDPFGFVLVVLSVGSRHAGFYCMGESSGPSGFGPFVAAHSELASPTGTLSIWDPYWVRDYCTTRTWAILGHVAPNVAEVEASTNSSEVRIRPVQGLFGFYLNQRIESNGSTGRLPFGSITAFNATGAVLSSSPLTSRQAGGRPFQNLCSNPSSHSS